MFYASLKMVQSSYKSYKTGVVTGRKNGQWEYNRNEKPVIFYSVVIIQFIGSSLLVLCMGLILVHSIINFF